MFSRTVNNLTYLIHFSSPQKVEMIAIYQKKAGNTILINLVSI